MYRLYLGTQSIGPGYRNYTRGIYWTLPTDNSDLSTAYTNDDYTTAAAKDSLRVAQLGNQQYMIHQFKDYAGANASANVEWLGQSDLAPTSSTIYLQIYNLNTTTWDTLTSNNSSGAGTDVDLTSSGISLTNYKDGDGVVTCRVYQQAI